MKEVYTKVPHTEYLETINRVKALEKENAILKANFKKITAKTEVKAEVKPEAVTEVKATKKGGNK